VGLEALEPWLRPGRTVALLGSSGAGKSTLTNTLLGRPTQATGAVRADDSRGRHTTTARTLHRLPGGACLIDTPGLRGLRVDLDEADLAASFGDIAQLAEKCRFRDCRHVDEPGCAVRDGVPADRLRNYHKLVREVRREQMTALERRRQLSEWKSRVRAAEQRTRLKRG
jgi:ribosome biogenesis GTPase